jgi:hypothetical protein
VPSSTSVNSPVRNGCEARSRDSLRRPGSGQSLRAARAQLLSERGPAGEPTAAEFAASDLLDIGEAFAVMGARCPCGSPAGRTTET